MDQQATQQRQASRPTLPASGSAVRGPRHARLTAIAAALNSAVAQRFAAATSLAAQRPPSAAGLPARLKAGVEALSGVSMDAVRVHRNSDRPAQLQAHAYAQGTDIHLAPGRDRHLPHEAWHVVQQAQGRVRPTTQLQAGVAINDDTALEREADRLGAKAAAGPPADSLAVQRVAAPGAFPGVAQRSPAQWVANHTIQTILTIPHGWFSTWKQIKQEIVVYQGLPRVNFVARRALLVRLDGLIAEWLANPKHPAGPAGDARVQRIHAFLPALQQLIGDERADMTAVDTEAVVGGHSLIRHGADSTDADLQNRITTGLDRGGNAAPADQSSRFVNHLTWVRTRTLAVNALDAATAATRAIVDPLLLNFEGAWWAGLTTLPGPGRGAALAAANALRAPISGAIGGIGLVNPNHLPVTYHVNMPVGGVPAVPAVHASVARMARTRQRYRITIAHAGGAGPSFVGTGPVGGPHPGTTPGPYQMNTTTIFDPPVGPLEDLVPAATWPMVTHYPSTDPVGIDST